MKIFSVLAEFVLWELSIVSSLSLHSILVQHACNDRAWLTSECSPRYAYHFHINYDLNLETAEFLELGLCDFGETVQRKALIRTMCSREIFTQKCRQQQIFDSDLKGACHYNHVTFTPIAKKFCYIVD